MYRKRTMRDWVYLSLALISPFAVGLGIRGTPEAAGMIAALLLACCLLLYEVRMYLLTPRIKQRWSVKEKIYAGIMAVALLFLQGIGSRTGAYAVGPLTLALCLAVRNYRMRRRWDARLRNAPTI